MSLDQALRLCALCSCLLLQHPVVGALNFCSSYKEWAERVRKAKLDFSKMGTTAPEAEESEGGSG